MNLQYLQEVQVRNLQFLQEVQVRNLCSKQLRILCPMGSTVFRNPWALSSALAALGTLQPRALGFLNAVDPLDTVSNCYLEHSCY